MRIVVTGGTGFLGQALQRLLPNATYLGSDDLDLTKDDSIRQFPKADVVINAAAKCGGIGYNKKHGVDLLDDNVRIGMNALRGAYYRKCKRFVQIGSVCMYPEPCPSVPFIEEDIWNGYPERTNAPYGLAKRIVGEAANRLNEEGRMSTVHLVLANMYGPGDNFDLEDSHVIPALITRFVEDEPLVGWGTGKPSRDFLYVDDAAEAIVHFAVGEGSGSTGDINIGTGRESSISEVAALLTGGWTWNTDMPDGQRRRCLDCAKAAQLGWWSRTSIEDGLARTLAWYKANRGL